MENELLPLRKPGLCLFLTLEKLINQCCHLNLKAHEIFFYSKSMRFLYQKEDSQDIQKKYFFYNYKKSISELSAELGFHYILKERQSSQPLDDALLLRAIKIQMPVMLTVHGSALTHNRERKCVLEDDYHCIRPIAYENGILYYHDDYVPHITAGYSVLDGNDDYETIFPYIRNYLVLEPQAVCESKHSIKNCILISLSTFMNEEKTGAASGIDAIRLLAKDIQFVLSDNLILAEKNLFGLLYLIKYQIYPSYYFLLESIISNLDINAELQRPILQNNLLWQELFKQLDVLMFKQTKPIVNRVSNLLLEISDKSELIITLYWKNLCDKEI